MINENVRNILNIQLNKEIYSEYLYLAMSAYFSNIGLAGFANWLRVQTQEEHSHAMLIYDYLINQGAEVVIDKMEKPEISWNSPLTAFEKVLAHEQFVTKSINEVMNVAENEKDRATTSYFMWFIDEQVQEENVAGDLVAKLKLIDDDKSALYMMDKDLALRIFTPPTKSVA